MSRDSMPPLSTAREALARLEDTIADERDPRRRSRLQTMCTHWWAEVVNDVDLIMTTMSHEPISYSSDGYPLLAGGDALADISTYDDVRRMYDAMAGNGFRMAGPIDQESFAFGESDVHKKGLNSVVFPGHVLHPDLGLDPERFHLVRWPLLVVIPFDDDGLMTGEHMWHGAPRLIREVPSELIDALFEGPIPF